jgi:hydrogenase nickel incorporation protein HypA/HybF
MHELSVSESILNIAIKHARTAGSSRIMDIYLVIGRLSSIVDDSVQFYWDFITEGTIAEGSKLHFRRLPAEMHCEDCDLNYAPGEGELACPECGGVRVRVISGDQFYVEAIEVEPAQDQITSGADKQPG